MSNGLHDVDVLLLGDLRVGGPYARWIAAALTAATARGSTVALRQLSTGRRAAVAPVDPAVRRLVDGAQVRLLVGDTPVRAGLVVAHDAAVLTAAQLPPVEGQRVVVVAETPPPTELETLVRDRFGAVPEWTSPDRAPADVLATALADGAPSGPADEPVSSGPPPAADQVAAPAPHAGSAPGAGSAPSAGVRTTSTAGRPTRERVLLISSNGVGMGHLTRLLSYATRLPADVEAHFLSMSQAVPIVGGLDLPYEYLPSAKAIGMRPDRWRRMFVRRVTETVTRLDPSVVVFDGTFPYQGIEEVREAHPRSRWVWSRRGMWKRGMSVEQVRKSAWFDAVLEPGDLAAPYDVGATRNAAAHPVGPVTLLDTADLQDRAGARRALGLPADGPLALLSLGAGNINDTSSAIGAAGEALRRLGVGVCVTVPEIASSGRRRETDIHLVRDYPLSRRYAAFDVAISAAGYNSFHELLRFGVPTLFVPNVHTQLDDQAARAQYAADQGWSRVLPELTVDDAETAVAHLLTHGARMAAAAQAQDPGNGAAAAAELVGTMAREARR